MFELISEAPVEKLAALLAGMPDLAGLSDVDLQNLKQEIKDAMREAREGELTREVTALMRDAKAQVLTIDQEETAREEERQAILAEAEEALEGLDDDETEAEGGPEPTTEEGEESAPEEPAEVPATEEPAPEAPPAEATDEKVPLAAAATPKRKPARTTAVPARHQPRITPRAPSIIASSGVRGINGGQQFSSLDAMNAAAHDKWVSLRAAADGRPHSIATLDWRAMYDEDHTLNNGDPYEVADKVMGVLDRTFPRNADRRESLLASGGVPGPPEPRYQQITLGQAKRPLRDSLPSFLASRGEIIFNTSPVLSEVLLDTASGAIGTVTSAQDLAGATKDVQEISAPVPNTVVVEAETMRWSQGNFADRFYPERTKAFMALGQVAYARHNEALRLADIKTGSTKFTDTPAAYGAYRDFKRAYLGVIEELEDRVRDFNLPIRVLLPGYLPAMLAADMVAQQPGDAVWTVTEDQMMADVEGWDPSVNVTWMQDSIRGRMLTTPTGQSPRSAGFDADVEWAAFPEGAWLFLDGGQLDLGIIRDSTLSATNKFQTFYESWEAVAQLIPISLWITSSLCSDGASQIATAISKCQPQGS